MLTVLARKPGRRLPSALEGISQQVLVRASASGSFGSPPQLLTASVDLFAGLPAYPIDGLADLVVGYPTMPVAGTRPVLSLGDTKRTAPRPGSLLRK